MIDKAIDHVLDRINKGKDIKIGPVFQERLSSANRCNNTLDHIDLSSNRVDIDDDDDNNNDANITAYNHVVYDRNQHNLNIKPKKNLVAISPCVSFMVKPVQSSASNNIKLNNNNNTNNNKKHQLSTEDYEELESFLQNDSVVNHIHYSTDYVVVDDNDRKHKHKKRKCTNDD
ncbi:unnamed protein product [Schistosoma mattheei]|uniref:Uncharacterized protein n=1 Tax=Schistosoma mattheei TaxID=31246 RepID=A0A183Q4A2_9TREM|nr:unnamed protein product [Schistosoma mattheei]